MSSPIKVIKTLPHLINLFLPQNELNLYANFYSQDILKFFENVKSYKREELTFSYLKEYLSQTFKTELTEINIFKRVEQPINKLQYAIKGDTISFWPIGYENPIRFEFFGEECEKIYLYDELINKRVKDIETVILTPILAIPNERTDIDNITFQNIDKPTETMNKIIFVNSLNRISRTESVEFIETDFQYPQLFYSRFDLLKNELKRLETSGYEIVVKVKAVDPLPEELKRYVVKKDERRKMKDNFQLYNPLNSSNLTAGFISNQLKLAVFTDREIFGTIYLSRPERYAAKDSVSSNIRRLLKQFEGDIEIGDYLVHEDYGVAIYAGLTQQEVDGQTLEYLLLKYADADELYVPITQIQKITKYIGPDNVEPKITRLGKVGWELIKAKIKKSTGLLAKNLIEHYAKRELSKAKALRNDESNNYKKFEDNFKYVETSDQTRAINEINSDLEKEKPMNRLLVGDVGFGKTEVFMRAAFRIVEAKGQVAVLAPTTILTAQHYVVFKERFKNFDVRIAYLSRFNTKVENLRIIDELNQGKIDIVIGTHRLLSSDVKFKNLQLLIVDEEQRFGVKQKEKIKQINYGVHVLAVSATPIPRTLSMALSAIQDISIISEPPKNRKPIHTEILKDNWSKVIKAISDEVQRGGQIYFVHNEIQTIQSTKAKLEEMLPGIKFIIGHGQMRGAELDKVMTDFYDSKYDCLISTTIIENGLDLPNVNTIIIDNANRFGLSQLYQLRGRVGRSEREAFCYLLYKGKNIKEEENIVDINSLDYLKYKKLQNKKYLERLQAMVDNQDLGAGFRIASRDLEIRGAGNLLGDQQSGHISTIGFALYIEMLSQEVERLKVNLEEFKNNSLI